MDRKAVLPQFPDFRALSAVDYDAVRNLVWTHHPYSDFNVACLLAWDTQSKIRVSRLNKNLIIKFYDYLEGQYFYSFIGECKPDRTAETLIECSVAEGLDAALHLIPHCVASRLDRSVFSVEEDCDETDYVLSVEQLCSYSGGQFASKRHEARKFQRQNPDASFRLIDLNDPRIYQQCRAMFQGWRQGRNNLFHEEIDREFEAFKRCLQMRSRINLFGAGVFVEGQMGGFTVCQIAQMGHAFNHFEKLDTRRFPGIGAFLTQQLAGELAKRDVAFLNIEQDLGMPGLRANKRSYAPCAFLRKYMVKFVEMRTVQKDRMALRSAYHSGAPSDIL